MDVLDQVNSNERKPNPHQVEYDYLEHNAELFKYTVKRYLLFLHAAKQICHQSSIPDE